MKYSKLGYKRYSPDLYNKYNVIPSGRITMKDVDFPVYGVDNLGNKQMMYPGGEYEFPGNEVFEIPMAQRGRQLSASTGYDSWYNSPIVAGRYTFNPKDPAEYYVEGYGTKQGPGIAAGMNYTNPKYRTQGMIRVGLDPEIGANLRLQGGYRFNPIDNRREQLTWGPYGGSRYQTENYYQGVPAELAINNLQPDLIYGVKADYNKALANRGRFSIEGDLGMAIGLRPEGNLGEGFDPRFYGAVKATYSPPMYKNTRNNNDWSGKRKPRPTTYSSGYQDGGRVKRYQTGGSTDSTLENLVEFFDPTGITSWDDASRAYNEWKKSNSLLPSTDQVIDMFGAVPSLGKLSKLKYLDPNAIKQAYKYFDWQKLINQYDAIQDELSSQKRGGQTRRLNNYQDGGENSTEQSPDRIAPVEITAKRDPWYKRLPRQVGNKMGLNTYGYDTDPNDFGSQFYRRVAANADSPGGAFFGALTAPFVAPQLAAMYAMTGKAQTPSEYFDIQNPVGAFVTDAVLDPANLAGAGLLKGAKVPIRPSQVALTELMNNPTHMTEDGINFMKNWVSHPDYAKRYDNYASLKDQYFGRDMQAYNMDQLEKYKHKNYNDLWVNEGPYHYNYYKNNSAGVSYGEPNRIYVDVDLHNQWANKYGSSDPLVKEAWRKQALGSTETHELSHLTDNNGYYLTEKEINAINQAVPRQTDLVGDVAASTENTITFGPDYFTDPTEVRARMMEGRFKYNMTPDQSFTPEMFDEISKSDGWFGMGPYITDKDKFINLMNTMRAVPGIGAAGLGASQLRQQNSGWLNQYQDGGRVKRYQAGGNTDTLTEYVLRPALKAFNAGADWLGEQTASAIKAASNYMDETSADVNEWFGDKIRPVEYPDVLTGAGLVLRGLAGNNAPPALDRDGDYAVQEEAWRKSLGLNPTPKYILPSEYRPSRSTDPNAQYYRISDNIVNPNKIIAYARDNDMQVGDTRVAKSLANYLQDGYMDPEEFFHIDPLANFTIGVGQDDKGRYVSMYDKYDFNSNVANAFITPFEIYNRYYYKKGGQHGGLDRWFAEKWVDIKTGKECGRQEGEKRGYPACRPSKRVSSKTPKTASELSSSEKAKFKSTKTSSKRIPYQHKRAQDGGVITRYNPKLYR